MKSGNSTAWAKAGASVQGATHIKQDKVCQDALYLHPHLALACVADGHGSDRCPFSDEGAQAAVEVATAILAEYLESSDPRSNLAMHKDIRLPRQVEAKWKEKIRAIHAEKEQSATDETSGEANYELYGTTLLALAAAPDFVFVLQIGDGDIIAIDPDGSACWLLPPADHSGNETESLCMDASWQYIRTALIPLDTAQPALYPSMFLLSTDGYVNSFTDSAGFLKAGADIYRLWRENSRAYIIENLPDWLTQTSADGSGDDITVALLVREKI